jgi:hypothetical protein
MRQTFGPRPNHCLLSLLCGVVSSQDAARPYRDFFIGIYQPEDKEKTMPAGAQRSGTDPNRGMNTKKYLIAVFAFLLVCCFAMVGWLHHTAKTNGDPSVETRTHAGDGATATDKGGK